MADNLETRAGHPLGADVRRHLNRVLRLTIVGALLEGLRRRDPSVIVNAVLSFAFAITPRVLERAYGVRFRPWQRLWVSASALVHTLGMLGPYDRIWWWDHLAHTLSGVVVAGAADVVFRAGADDRDRTTASSRNRSAFVVGVTLAFGLLWELLEYLVHSVADRVGLEPLLVHYGRLDTVGDLLYDLLGAALVLRFGRRALSNVVESVADDPSSALSRHERNRSR